jgi:hypothetical protein
LVIDHSGCSKKVNTCVFFVREGENVAVNTDCSDVRPPLFCFLLPFSFITNPFLTLAKPDFGRLFSTLQGKLRLETNSFRVPQNIRRVFLVNKNPPSPFGTDFNSRDGFLGRSLLLLDIS